MHSGRGVRIPSLDGIRAVAITVVFVSHAPGLPSPLHGSSGVTIFFFLSGYLITALLLGEHERTGRISLGGFYARRAFRILPAMYVALGLGVVAGLVGLVAGRPTLGSAAAQAAHLTNYWILADGRGDLPASNLALWSLSVEEHFYLLYPLLLIGLWRLSRRPMVLGWVLAAVCALVMMWRIHLVGAGASFDRLYLSTDTRLDSILAGGVLALVADPARRRVPGPDWLWVRVVLPVCAVVFWWAQATPSRFAMTLGYEIQALCLAGMFVAVIRFPDCAVGRVLNHRWAVRLGVLSYSVYLLHELVIALGVDLLGESTFAGVLAAVVVTGCAELTYRLVERPALDLRRRLAARSGAKQGDRENSPVDVKRSTGVLHDLQLDIVAGRQVQID